jgi:hypothetical protein
MQSQSAGLGHIDGLFKGHVEWELIETMLPDMLRVGIRLPMATPQGPRVRRACWGRCLRWRATCWHQKCVARGAAARS